MEPVDGVQQPGHDADVSDEGSQRVADTGLIWGLSKVLESDRADAAGRRADDAEARLRDQAMLFAEAEHKLKTSLGIVAGWARTLDDRWDELSEETRREAVATVRRTTDDLWAHCDAMLQELRTEVSVLEMEPVRLDLDAVLAVATMGYAGAALAHRFVHVPAGPVWSWVDPASLQQILGHLFDNAVKYSPRGTTITVTACDRGDCAELRVADEGIGLPEGVDVFAPFSRGRAQVPDNDSPGGVGLGLYVVRKLAEGMNGSITAEAVATGGTEFIVRLPAGRLRASASTQLSG